MSANTLVTRRVSANDWRGALQIKRMARLKDVACGTVNIDCQYSTCTRARACARLCDSGFGMCEWVQLTGWWEKLRVSQEGDVRGVAVIRGSAEWRAWKQHALSSPWQRVPPIRCNAYLYSWFNFEMAGLILLCDSSANRTLGGLNISLLAVEPIASVKNLIITL